MTDKKYWYFSARDNSGFYYGGLTDRHPILNFAIRSDKLLFFTEVSEEVIKERYGIIDEANKIFAEEFQQKHGDRK